MTYNIPGLSMSNMKNRNRSICSSTSTGDSWVLFFDWRGKLVRIDSAQHGSFDFPQLVEDGVFLYQQSEPGFKKRLCLPTNERNGPISFCIRRNILAYHFDAAWTIVEKGTGILNCDALLVTESDEKLSSLAHCMHEMACEIKNGHIPSEEELGNLVEEISALRK